MFQKVDFKIDAHTHLGPWPTYKSCENDLIYSFNNYNLSFILVSVDQSETRNKNILRFKDSLEYILDFSSRYKGIGILIWVPLKRRLTSEEKEYLINYIKTNKNKIHGIKLHPYLSKTRINKDAKNMPFYLSLAREFNLPILVHSANDEYSKIGYLIEIAKLNPDINFISAHVELMGDIKRGMKLTKNVPNLYLDTAWVDPKFIKYAEKIGIIDKIIFGSDSPIDGATTLDNPMYQDLFNNKHAIKKENLDKILYKNAMKVYSIKTDNLINRIQRDK